MAGTPIQLALSFTALDEVRPPWRSLVLIAAASEGLDFDDIDANFKRHDGEMGATFHLQKYGCDPNMRRS
jgi:hypothetical protein